MSAATESRPIVSASSGEFVLRLVYFALAPVAIVLLARIVPIIGIVVNVGIALLVFAFAEAVRSLVTRYPLLARVLGGALRFEQYYRTHPPKPFLYYALYPLLFPYWLSNATARREFALFRNLGAVGFVILIGSAAWDYGAHWQPELKFSQFFGSWIAVFLFQTVVTMMFVMPLATSVVALELAGQRRRLFVLLGVAIVVVALSIVHWARKRHEYVQLPTAQRMLLRTRANPKRSLDVRTNAVQAAGRLFFKRREGEAVKEGRGEVEVLGPPIDEARNLLQAYYLPDETMAFHLVAMRTKANSYVILYGMPPTRKTQPVWIGVRKDGKVFTNVDELPSDAFSLMRRAAER